MNELNSDGNANNNNNNRNTMNRNKYAPNRKKSKIEKVQTVRHLIIASKITQIKSLKVSPMVEAVIECDTDVDTYCLGRNCVVLEHTNSTADIHSHDKSNTPQVGIQIVTGATAYDNLVTG